MVTIAEYDSSMEMEWVLLRARVVARSHTWDFVERQKVKYENPSVELVLKNEGKIVGYIDAEIEKTPGEICWGNSSRGAVVQEYGVAPEYQMKGFGKILLLELVKKLQSQNIQRIEFWTKDPKSVAYYQHLKLKEIFRHDHFRIPAEKIAILKSQYLWKPIYAYMIKNADAKVREALQDVPLEPHICYGFEWQLQK